MAISNDAYTTSNKYEVVVEEFKQAMGTWQSQLDLVAKVEIEPNAASKRIYAETPVADIPTWNGTADLTALDHGVSHTTTVNAAAYGGRLTFTEIEENRSPGIVQDAAQRLTMAVQRTLESLVFTRLEAGDSDTVDDGNGGTTAVFSAGHKTSGDDQDNRIAGALAGSTLDSCRQSLRGWKNAVNQPLELDRGPMTLVVPPALGDTARRLVNSPNYYNSEAVNASSGQQINPMADRAISICETAYLSSNAEYYLISRDFTPLRLWLPTAPTMRILQNPINRKYEVSVVFEATAYWVAPIMGVAAGNITVE